MLTELSLLRGIHLLCLVSLLGTLTARCVLEPESGEGRGVLISLAHASLLLAVATMLAWLLLQAASMANATSFDGAFAALPTVVQKTRFGHVLLLRLALLAVAWPLLGGRRIVCTAAALLTAVAIALQAALGHAGAAPGGVGTALLASESLHLIAAGAWLGGLLPLLLLVRTLPTGQASAVARRFTAIGLPAVLVLVATALVQGDALVGGLPGLFGTDYGHVALLKLALFLLLLVLALINRFVLTTRFERGRTGRACFGLAVAIEALAGVAVVMAAAVLASQEPGIHAEPIWPFALRPSMAAMADPDIGREVILALTAGGAGLLIIASGVALRRWRLVLLALGFAGVAYAVPHLRPLLVQAYPTSYARSPSGFATDSIVRGAALFAANCVACHGAEGRGDGPRAKTLAVPPANLTEAHLWEHTDGELFWWLTHGIDNPEGGLSMPGYGTVLSKDDRWALIDFVRANNAGVALRETGAWPVPIPTPGLPLICADGSQIDMAALRGRLAEILAGVPARATETAVSYHLATVHIVPQPGSDHVADGCQAATQSAWLAYAILTGVPPTALTGTIILVDASGWLRSVVHTDGKSDEQRTLAPRLAEIAHNPIGPPAGASHAHH
jgi:putative copper export protein/mono/diheme cytochrome c family protein